MQTLNPYLTPILNELEQFFHRAPLSNEHQIIKHLQTKKVPPFDTFSLADSKDLFNAHFLCMHALYHLKKQYQLSKTYRLSIHSVQIQRIAIDKTLATVQPLNAIQPVDPLASYYLDSKHYFDTQEDEINKNVEL